MNLDIQIKKGDGFSDSHLEAVAFLARSFLKEQFDLDVTVAASYSNNPNMPFFMSEFPDYPHETAQFNLWTMLYDLIMQLHFQANTASGLKCDAVMFIPSWSNDMVARFYDQIHSTISAGLPNITINVIKLVPVTQDNAGVALFNVYGSDNSDETKDKIQATQSQLQILFRTAYGMFK